MQKKRTKQPHRITLEFPLGITRSVMVRAVSREVAEHRALKRNPNAIKVVPNA